MQQMNWIGNTQKIPYFFFCVLFYVIFILPLSAQSPADKEIFKNADKFIRAENYREALNALDAVSAAGRNESRYMFFKAYSYEKLNEPDKALENYRLFYSKTKSLSTQQKIEELEQLIEQKTWNENARKNCRRCSGSGYYDDFKGCEACNHTGRRATTCNRCYGDGEATCYKCNGSGIAVGLSIMNAISQGLNSTGSSAPPQNVPCTTCQGSGTQRCYSCSNGQSSENCYMCNGAGKLPVKSECITHQP